MKTELFVHIDEQGITNKKAVKNAFDNLNAGKYLVTIENKNKRTSAQNRYLHMMFSMVQQGLYDNGYREIKDAEQAKYVCKKLFLSYTIKNEETGATIECIKRTRDLTKLEMAEFIDQIIQWSSEYLNVVIPPPGAQIDLFVADYDNEVNATIVKRA